MSMIPRPVARELDALSRAAHRFHRFAHHPLCDEYAGEVVRLGRRGRVCRGCLFAAVGTLVGGTASLVFRVSPVFAAALVVATAALVHTTTVLRSGKRFSKLLTRFLPGVALGLALCVSLGATAWPRGGLVLLTGLVYGSAAVLYRRRGGDRTPCATCPERTRATPCRGLAPIVRRERAFQRAAARVLTRAGIFVIVLAFT